MRRAKGGREMLTFGTRMQRPMAACALLLVAGPVAGQPAYPMKPIRFITPFPPGGSTDPVLRLVGAKLTEAWGQNVIADNRPGGNTVIGTDAVAKAPPDGYTMLMAPSGALIGTALLVRTPYDLVRDLAPVATIARGELVLVVHPSVPVNDLKGLIALAKNKPGQLNYGASGTGGTIHMATETLSLMTGIKMQHVPYKGSGPLVSELIGGQIQLAFQFPISVLGHIGNGRLKPIAYSGESRLPAMPRVPTFTEAGLPGLDVKNWFGIFAPTGTPQAVIDKWSSEVARIISLPDVNEKLASQALAPFVSNPEQIAQLIRASIERYARVIKAASIKIE